MPYIHFIQIRSTCFYTVHNNVFVCSSLVDSILSFKHPLSLKLDWSSAGLNKTVGSFTLIIREVLMVSVKWGVGGFRNVKGKCTNSVLKNNTSATNTHTQPAVGHRFRLWFWCCHWCLNWTLTVWVTNRVYNKATMTLQDCRTSSGFYYHLSSRGCLRVEQHLRLNTDLTPRSLGSPMRYDLFSCQPIGHSDTPPLDVRSPLTGRWVGRALLAVGEGKSGF